jgi:hypothetical protein
MKRQNKLSLPVQRKAATLIITLLLLYLSFFLNANCENVLMQQQRAVEEFIAI